MRLHGSDLLHIREPKPLPLACRSELSDTTISFGETVLTVSIDKVNYFFLSVIGFPVPACGYASV